MGLGPSLYPGADVVFCQIPGKASSVISRQLQRERHDLRPSGTFKKSLCAGCRTHIKPRREESSFLGVQENGLAHTKLVASREERNEVFLVFKKTDWHLHGQCANEPASGNPRLHERCLPIVDSSHDARKPLADSVVTGIQVG